MSLTEEILGYTSLVMRMLAAYEVASIRKDEVSLSTFKKLKAQVETVSREIILEHGDIDIKQGKQERLL